MHFFNASDTTLSTGRKWLLMKLASACLVVSVAMSIGSSEAAEVAVYDAESLQTAMRDAKAGDDIVLYPGRYQGIKTQYPKGRWHYFHAQRSGTASAPITLRSYSSDDMQILTGNSVNSAGYILYVTGDHWLIKDIKFHTGQKGIMLDSANHNVLDNIAVHTVRDEGVHFRDSSSNNVLRNCHIYKTGLLKPGFGEAVYVGSHEGNVSGDHSNGNRIGGCQFGPGVTAEAVDIKAGTINTVVEHNRIFADGISGVNFADSFIDVKGDKVVIRYNRMDWKNNSLMNHGIHFLRRDHQSSDIYGNTVVLGEDMEFLKIGQGTVHSNNNHINYRGPLASIYGSGSIDDTLSGKLPTIHSYEGFDDDAIQPSDPESCHKLERRRKAEIDVSESNCIDVPTELAGKLVQVWDSNQETSCNFRGSLVSTSSDVEWAVSSNYEATRNMTGTRIRIVPSNECFFLIVRWM